MMNPRRPQPVDYPEFLGKEEEDRVKRQILKKLKKAMKSLSFQHK
jgi:hypothetical protein